MPFPKFAHVFLPEEYVPRPFKELFSKVLIPYRRAFEFLGRLQARSGQALLTEEGLKSIGFAVKYRNHRLAIIPS